MEIRKQFQRIETALQAGEQSTLAVEADGQTYTRIFRPGERLILLGAGNIAQPLCEIAVKVGFSVVVVDDRSKFANEKRFPDADQVICDDFLPAIRGLKIRSGDYVCVITRGHQYDADCLREILPGTMPYYLGMIGSRRRTIELLRLLGEEGFDQDKIDQIHTPIGVPIGALTVPEIAVSIVAELVQERRKNTKRHSKSNILTNEDVNEKLIHYLAADESPKAFLLVLETSGSTPVKSGSCMAVSDLMQQQGTIGGGCGESAVLHEALEIIGTGKSRVTTVRMDNDVASEEGMVCGGSMKVLIQDVR